MALQQPIQFNELLAWMKENGCQFRDLQEKTGLDKMTLHRLARGTFKTFRESWVPPIARVTAGAVGPNEFSAFLMRRLSATGQVAA